KMIIVCLPCLSCLLTILLCLVESGHSNYRLIMDMPGVAASSKANAQYSDVEDRDIRRTWITHRRT
ncbi:hypothetical protein Y032_0130g1518, partial [Ancylostoma ceylanicum]